MPVRRSRLPADDRYSPAVLCPLPNRYLHPLRIGDVELANNLILAPMAGFTNLGFRLLAKEIGGCGLVASEMVAALSRGETGRGN